jgi:hypothetical protein
MQVPDHASVSRTAHITAGHNHRDVPTLPHRHSRTRDVALSRSLTAHPSVAGETRREIKKWSLARQARRADLPCLLAIEQTRVRGDSERAA